MQTVKSVICTEIPKKYIQNHKFSKQMLADKILEPYLKQTDHDVPLPIYIAPWLSKKEFDNLVFTKHMTPLFNEWRHRTQSAIKNMYFSNWPGNGQFVTYSWNFTSITLIYWIDYYYIQNTWQPEQFKEIFQQCYKSFQAMRQANNHISTRTIVSLEIMGMRNLDIFSRIYC